MSITRGGNYSGNAPSMGKKDRIANLSGWERQNSNSLWVRRATLTCLMTCLEQSKPRAVLALLLETRRSASDLPYSNVELKPSQSVSGKSKSLSNQRLKKHSIKRTRTRNTRSGNLLLAASIKCVLQNNRDQDYLDGSST